ncbi:MAG: ribosome maturation factor RimP [Aquificae bacterium]|jgi:ribosome maturation factor RimP|nr:ribosome maturation factor RimP [Aquificota bacterium]
MSLKEERERIEQQTKELIKDIVQEQGLRLFDVEYRPEGRGWTLRVIVDKFGGVNIGDLERLSRTISPLLDVEDFIPHSYHLEVTSPGLTRELKKPEHFAFFIGRLIKVITKEPIEGKRELVGFIDDIENGILKVRIKGEDKIVHIPLSAIAKARLEVEW